MAPVDDVRVTDVRSYWEAHPVAAAMVPFPLGTPDYFSSYDRLRERNESVAFSHALHEYRSFKGKKVLDVGCGNGYVLSRYAAEGAEVHGIDLTQAGIALCRSRFNGLGLRGAFQVGNAEALPYADNTFDCVCSMGVLHHTPNTTRAVAEIHRILVPGGRLIVMFYHRNSALNRIRFPLDRLLTGKSHQQLVNEVDGIGNPKGDVYSKAELRQLLHAFTDLELFARLLTGPMCFPLVGRLIPAAVLRPLESRLGWFLYAKGRKPLRA